MLGTSHLRFHDDRIFGRMYVLKVGLKMCVASLPSSKLGVHEMVMKIMWNGRGIGSKHVSRMGIDRVQIDNHHPHIDPRCGQSQYDGRYQCSSQIYHDMLHRVTCSGAETVRIHKLVVDFVYVLIEPGDLVETAVSTIEPEWTM